MATGKEDKGKERVTPLKRKLEELKALIDKNVYKSSYHYAYYFKKWHSETLYILGNMYGEKSKEVTRFEKATQLPSGKATQTQWQKYRFTVMLKAAAELEAMLSTPRKSSKQKTIDTANTFIFIAHGGRTEALNKVQTFIGALGITPLLLRTNPAKAFLSTRISRSVLERLIARLFWEQRMITI